VHGGDPVGKPLKKTQQKASVAAKLPAARAPKASDPDSSDDDLSCEALLAKLRVGRFANRGDDDSL
jgi:hypothetical protein